MQQSQHLVPATSAFYAKTLSAPADVEVTVQKGQVLEVNSLGSAVYIARDKAVTSTDGGFDHYVKEELLRHYPSNTTTVFHITSAGDVVVLVN